MVPAKGYTSNITTPTNIPKWALTFGNCAPVGKLSRGGHSIQTETGISALLHWGHWRLPIFPIELPILKVSSLREIVLRIL